MNYDYYRQEEQLMIYLADAEDNKVDALYSLLENEIKDKVFVFTDEHISIVEKRRADYLSGKSTMIPWQEVHERIRNKRKSS